jgi:hypothetical protein
MSEPQVRALTSQVALQHVDTLSSTLRASILHDAGDVEAARRAYQFGWIPFALQIRILDAMRRHQSPEAWQASQRVLMHGYLDKPVLRGLLDTAVRLLGLSVATLARWTPRAWDALFKHAGALRIDSQSEGRIGFVLERFPPELMRSGSFVESLQAALEVIFVLAKVEGRVEIDAVHASSGEARFTLRW